VAAPRPAELRPASDDQPSFGQAIRQRRRCPASDPALEQAAATLGAGPRRRFLHVFLPLLAPGLAINFCLSFVQSFSVFPSAVLLGAPAGETRVIAIAAYQAAFERFDYSMGSAIAIIMAVVQLVVVILVLGLRQVFYRGATSGGKG